MCTRASARELVALPHAAAACCGDFGAPIAIIMTGLAGSDEHVTVKSVIIAPKNGHGETAR